VSNVRRSRLLFAGFVSLAMVAVACGGSSGSKGGNNAGGTVAPPSGPPSTQGVKEGGTLNYGADQELTGFNPNTSKDNGTSVVNVMARVWASAFHYTPDFKVVLDKDLMVSADVTTQNPQVVTMKINPKATWSDGVPVTADDFVYFWKMQKDPANTNDSCTNGCASNGKPVDDYSDGTGYKLISSVVGSDGGKTVTITFSEPYADWRSLWQFMPPSHIAQKVGWNDGFDKFDPAVILSAGPYKIQSYNVGKDLTEVPNDKYWAAKPHLDSIVHHFITDSAQQVPALQNKEVDFIYPQPQLDQVNAVKQLGDVNSEINFGLSFEHIDFNVKTPGLDDLVVRKAIATAIDRPRLVQRTAGQFSSKATILNNRMWMTNQPEYKDTSGGAYDKGDPAKAKQMLESDGYALGADGIYAKAGKRLSFRISTTLGNALRQNEEALMQADVKAAGIEFKIDNTISKDYFGKRLPQHNFDIDLFAWVSSPFASGNNPIYSQCQNGTCASNYGQIGNDQADQLMKQGAAELDHAKVADIYNQVDKIAWDNMWTLPLYQKPTFTAVRNTFVNIHDNSTSEGPFWNAQTWGLKTSTQ
jgi:peptide/nickel transport system substrate-binding protein